MFHARTLNIIKDGENQISMASFLFDHADNSIIDNAQALRGMRAQFQKEFETYREITPSFSRLACQLMERQHWNSSIFKEKTLLDEATHSRIVNGEDKLWTFDTVMAFCVGYTRVLGL